MVQNLEKTRTVVRSSVSKASTISAEECQLTLTEDDFLAIQRKMDKIDQRLDCGEVGYFQRDCKYDGDKPTDGWQEQEGSFDSYDPAVGKWMTNLVATTPIMAKAMKSLYAKLNRQKDLKRSYRRKYKDLQTMVTTTTEPPVTLP